MIACAAIAAALLTGSVTTGNIVCPDRVLIRNLPARSTGVTLTAVGATFADGITVLNSHGLTIIGGTYGTPAKDTSVTYAIQASGVTDFSIANARFYAGPGGNRGGVQIRNGVRVTVRDSYFEGHRTGLMGYEVTDALFARNTFRKATSDGINMVGSHRFIIAGNDFFWSTRVGSAHPDGIQLWSLKDKPTQSDGWIVNNKMVGMMQGILSSDPKTEPGSGIRLHFHGNYAAVIFSHTITGGLLRDSVATDNVLSSYPGAFFGDLGGSLKGFEASRGNTQARNVRYNGKVTLPPRVYWWGDIPIAGKVGSQFDSRSHMLGNTVQP
jgi:hypothetical protein